MEIEFEAVRLDHRNWVVDFGGMKEVKKFLENTFDHKLVAARDDPQAQLLEKLAVEGVADVVWMDRVGCEAFSSYIFDYVTNWLINNDYAPRVRLKEVRVREHEGNSGFTRKEQY